MCDTCCCLLVGGVFVVDNRSLCFRCNDRYLTVSGAFPGLDTPTVLLCVQEAHQVKCEACAALPSQVAWYDEQGEPLDTLCLPFGAILACY
jgi:hypothetical protein